MALFHLCLRMRGLILSRHEMADVDPLQEEARRRRERLLAFKQQRGSKKDNDENDNTKQLPKPIFRSYTPQSDSLKENKLPRANPGNVEEKIKDQLEAGKPTEVIEEVDLMNLAPRKPDWDLKRDVAKKLEKLEKRTQKAIAELIRDRLKQGQENLVESVNAATKSAQNTADSDDD
uniref:Coiled-coil domain-containing protein 12 n=1 Tax=Strigamia maritima TaxID=126957 RepID=T1ISS2_STRMM